MDRKFKDVDTASTPVSPKIMAKIWVIQKSEVIWETLEMWAAIFCYWFISLTQARSLLRYSTDAVNSRLQFKAFVWFYGI